MDERLPLTAEDRAILDLESDEVAGHTLKVIRLEAPGVTVDQLKASVAERIGSAPELTRKLGGEPGAPFWMPDPDFDLDRHIAIHSNGEEVSNDEIHRATAELLAERLDRALPLWRIDVAPTTDGGTALIWRIHHVMADGTTAMRLARRILWDQREVAGQTRGPSTSAGIGSPGARSDGPSTPGDSSHETSADHKRRRRHILGLYEREFSKSPSPSPFDGEIGKERTVSFATVSLANLHDAAKSLAGATLNDAVLAVLSGTLRHWIEFHEGLQAESLRVKVPVSLHHGDDDAANRDSYFSVPLPLSEPDPLTRLKLITEATGERKDDHDAEGLDAILRRASRTSTRLGRLLTRTESSPRRFALSVSNVKGPPGGVSVDGAPVETIHSVVEIGRHHALRIAVLSIDDRLCFGFCADPELVTDLDEMAAGAEREAAVLERIAATEG